MTGAILIQYTFTFYINQLLTWEECNNLVDTTNSVKILASFIPALNKPAIGLEILNDEIMYGDYAPINAIPLSDNIILNHTYEFST